MDTLICRIEETMHVQTFYSLDSFKGSEIDPHDDALITVTKISNASFDPKLVIEHVHMHGFELIYPLTSINLYWRLKPTPYLIVYKIRDQI